MEKDQKLQLLGEIENELENCPFASESPIPDIKNEIRTEISALQGKIQNEENPKSKKLIGKIRKLITKTGVISRKLLKELGSKDNSIFENYKLKMESFITQLETWND